MAEAQILKILLRLLLSHPGIFENIDRGCLCLAADGEPDHVGSGLDDVALRGEAAEAAPAMDDRITQLERDVEDLKRQFEQFRRQFE